MKILNTLMIAIPFLCFGTIQAQDDYVDLPQKDSCRLFIGATEFTDTMTLEALQSPGKLTCQCTSPELTGEWVEFDVKQATITKLNLVKDASAQTTLDNLKPDHTRTCMQVLKPGPADIVQFSDLVIVYKEALYTTPIPFVTVVASTP